MGIESRSRVDIRYATEEDAPSLGRINHASFEPTALFHSAFPGADAPSLSRFKSAMSLKHLSNPQTHVLVGVDPDSKEILAYCRWHIPENLGCNQPINPLSEDGAAAAIDPMAFAPDSMNEEVYNAFKVMLEQGRAKYATDRDMVLEFLATAPGHQRKGIGSVCLNWGLEKADALKVRVYLEATPEGYPLYLRLGWKPLQEVIIDYKQFGGQGSQKLVLMMRGPTSS